MCNNSLTIKKQNICILFIETNYMCMYVSLRKCKNVQELEVNSNKDASQYQQQQKKKRKLITKIMKTVITCNKCEGHSKQIQCN